MIKATGNSSIPPIHIAFCTDIHSEYVIIVAFPQLQWIHESPSIFRYPYIACPYPYTDATILFINPTNALICLTITLLHSYMFQHSRGHPQGALIIYYIFYSQYNFHINLLLLTDIYIWTRILLTLLTTCISTP